MPRGHEPKTLREILEELRKQVGREKQRVSTEVQRAWEEAAGEAASHSTPTLLRDGILYVSVDSPAWLLELGGYKKAELLARLQKSVKSKFIADIRFRQR